MTRESPLRVLVVEDNPGDARLIEAYLEESRRWRFEVEIVPTLQDAEAAEKRRVPDVVLLDLSLPDGEGLELFRRARAIFDAPLVLVTGRDGDELVEAMAAEGAQDYLVKGRFDVDVLSRAVVSARERHELVQALAARERELRTMLENTPDIVSRFDRDGRIRYVNGALERILGVPRTAVLGKKATEMEVDLEDKEGLATTIGSVLSTGQTAELEHRVRTPLGVRWFQTRCVPEEDEGGEVTSVLTTSRDVTRRVRAQQQLEETAAALRERVKEAECLYGVSRLLYDAPSVEETLPAVVELLSEGFQHTDRAGARIELEDRVVTSSGFVESPWRIRQEIALEGISFGFVEVSYSDRVDDGSGDPFLLEERILLGGVAERIEAALRWERSRREMEEAASRLRRARTMEAMGQLAGGVAHDFNNLLTAISGYAELLLMEVGDESMRRDLEEIRDAAEKAGDLTGQLLAFGRRQVLQPRILDLAAVVREANRMLSRVVGEDVRVVLELPDDEVWVEADRGQLEEALVGLAAFVRGNLLEGGRMTIRLALEEHAAGSWALLTVQDDGSGLDPGAVGRVFDPFFTSRELGFGWGLGLATVHGIVEQSGGTIGVDAAPGEGTTFEIRLPLVEGEPEVRRSPPSFRSALIGKKVLVIEDDRAVRDLVARALAAGGYQVETAEDGQTGLEKATRIRRDLGLVITDVVMPEIRGPELARRLLGIAGDVPILFISGYAEEGLPMELVRGRRAFLQKPFSTNDLLARVEHLLSGGERSQEAS